MARLFKEYDFYGMVRVTTNVAELQDFFSFLKGKTFPATDAKAVRIHVEERYRLDIDRGTYKRIGDFLYNQQTDSIYFDLPYPFPVQLMVSGIASNNITIRVTSAFLKLPTVMRGSINFIYLFREILLLKLIEKGHLFLHGASVAFGNNGVVMTAFANTGKTYLSYGLAKRGFARLLADEYTLINGQGLMRAFPGMSALSPQTIKEHAIRITSKERLLMRLCQMRSLLLPFLFEPVIWVPATRIFPESTLCPEVKARYLVFLQRGSEGFSEIDKRQAFKKLALLTENEFPCATNYLLQVYSYLRPDFDLFEYQTKANLIINSFVDKIEQALTFSFSIGKNAESPHVRFSERLGGTR